MWNTYVKFIAFLDYIDFVLRFFFTKVLYNNPTWGIEEVFAVFFVKVTTLFKKK